MLVFFKRDRFLLWVNLFLPDWLEPYPLAQFVRKRRAYLCTGEQFEIKFLSEHFLFLLVELLGINLGLEGLLSL